MTSASLLLLFTCLVLLPPVVTQPAAPGAGPNSVIHVVIIGGTGDLAQKYLWRGFFELFQERHGKDVWYKFYGSSRGSSDEEAPKLLTILNTKLTCVDSRTCEEQKSKFINQTQYFQLKTEHDYQQLAKHLHESARDKYGKEIGRVFYLSLPPRAYLRVSNLIHQHCRPENDSTWIRLVLEKPFGHNKETALNMTKVLTSQFQEDEIYRVDHYLGKGVVKHILPLRAMNRENLDELLNRNHVERVEISMLETVGLKGRVDFYDQYGVICDVMQNHMLEMMTLIAMDLPVNISDSDQIKDNKLRLIKQIVKVQGRSLLTAQYDNYQVDGAQESGNSNFSSETATFAAAVLNINSPRWQGIPFILVSGKKLKERVSYIRIIFKNSVFNLANSRPFADERTMLQQLVFHIEHGSESEPAIFASRSLATLNIPNSLTFHAKTLSKTIYQQPADDILSFCLTNNVDAYTAVIVNILDGRHEHFVGSDHLLSLWDVWSGVLSTESMAAPRLYNPSQSDSQLAFSLKADTLTYNVKLTKNVINAIDNDNHLKIKVKPSEFLDGKLVVSDTDDVISSMSGDIRTLVERAVEERGMAHVAFSGGRTAQGLFRYLAQQGSDLPWAYVHIWLVDERCVAMSDHQSNFDSLQQNLLSFVNIPYLNVHPMWVETAGRICEIGDRADQLYEASLRHWLPNLQFDLIVLGVGTDGHTASLFPGQASLGERSRLAVRSTAPHSDVTHRITMTYTTINSAWNVFILVTGEGKHDIIQVIQSSEADKNNFPILGVQPKHGNVTWYMDDNCFYG
ncbi:GDH/6PGL endoplasmic bifunctional protein-like [Liolophura sinensis]|uniref:GDH/6PGL endoplasmic bifunctional protein-like n=1 Tax=Liolophura sinensis TaxID=3198878 RepID=UPI0031594B39